MNDAPTLEGNRNCVPSRSNTSTSPASSLSERRADGAAEPITRTGTSDGSSVSGEHLRWAARRVAAGSTISNRTSPERRRMRATLGRHAAPRQASSAGRLR